MRPPECKKKKNRNIEKIQIHRTRINGKACQKIRKIEKKIKKYSVCAVRLGGWKEMQTDHACSIFMYDFYQFQLSNLNRKLSMSEARQEFQLVLKIYRIFHKTIQYFLGSFFLHLFWFLYSIAKVMCSFFSCSSAAQSLNLLSVPASEIYSRSNYLSHQYASGTMRWMDGWMYVWASIHAKRCEIMTKNPNTSDCCNKYAERAREKKNTYTLQQNE